MNLAVRQVKYDHQTSLLALGNYTRLNQFPRYSLRAFVAVMTSFAMSLGLMREGLRPESIIFCYGLIAGIVLAFVTTLVAGAKLTPSGSVWRLILIVAIIFLALSPFLFPSIH